MRKRVLALLFMGIVIVLTGCWNRNELTDLAFVVGMAIDNSDDQIEVSIQVVEPQQINAKGGSTRIPAIMYKSKADTLAEALRKMMTVCPRKPYVSHLRVLAIGESLARVGIADTLDYISRDHEFRNDFSIIIAKGGKGADVLSILTALEPIPSNSLFDTLRVSSREWAPTTTITLDELITDLVSQGKNPVLSGIERTGDLKVGRSLDNLESTTPNGNVRLVGLAVFQKDKLVGWLDEADSKGYNYIEGNVKRTIGNVTCADGGQISFEVLNTKSNMKGVIKNGEPQIDIRLLVEQNVAEVKCQVDLMKLETIEGLQERSNKQLKELIQHTIHEVQAKYQSDIFGFGEVIHRNDPKGWQQIKDNWQELFTKLSVNVEVETKTRLTGTTSNSLVEELKKKK
ncbi:Ger(x)C family spore germination protein [Paenibacillus qinlingensis]|uniref:Spore germination protein KC n=1 Tax=Paenibacillus qinlingensis TaxID=1837343 RepID=A0ABU1NZI2_9BACL|nr:Ger(x)C family spore germination protein [Paenibacillus qinlingensis]MDR6552912.1 spore germination protein KC [Paenibacillus qinlingensis]